MNANDRRLALELRIMRRYVKNLLAAGFSISVNDGETTTVRRSTNFREIIRAMRTTDEDYLYVYKPGEDERFGMLYFVYGNDPSEVVNDYSMSLDEAISEANAYAESWSD